MGYSFLNIDINEWESYINQYTEVNVFGTEAFIKATASVYNCNLDIKVVSFNNKPILAVPLFTRSNKVVTPNHYYYQYIWEKDSSKESWTQIEALDFLLKELQKKYKEIKLRLPIKIKDVRPFIWNNFNIEIRYTYEKDLNDLRYNRNLQRILRKPQTNYSFKKNCDWQCIWDFHFKDLAKLRLRKKDISSYILYFKGLKEKNQIEVFNAYYNDVFINSIITIIDYKSKSAYFALMGSEEYCNYERGLPTFLYSYALNELKKADILMLDFLGANIQSISKYKNKFLPTLESFYEVFYSESSNERKQFFLEGKRFIKKLFFLVIN